MAKSASVTIIFNPWEGGRLQSRLGESGFRIMKGEAFPISVKKRVDSGFGCPLCVLSEPESRVRAISCCSPCNKLNNVVPLKSSSDQQSDKT
jgi:hypothetical protein